MEVAINNGKLRNAGHNCRFLYTVAGNCVARLIAIAAFKSQWRLAGLRLLAVTLTLSIAYGLMFFDGWFNIWSTFGHDYSTHTAVSLALVAFLITDKPSFAALWLGSFAAYVLLMLYQGYHTIADIAVTGVIAMVPIGFTLAHVYRRWRVI
jgi:hypothetical protein